MAGLSLIVQVGIRVPGRDEIAGVEPKARVKCKAELVHSPPRCSQVLSDGRGVQASAVAEYRSDFQRLTAAVARWPIVYPRFTHQTHSLLILGGNRLCLLG